MTTSIETKLKSSPIEEMILKPHPTSTARKRAITMAAAGFLIANLAACNAEDHGGQVSKNRASEIKYGMLYSEVVAILGPGEAGKVPVDCPIHCDSWKYDEGKGTRYLNVEFNFTTIGGNYVDSVSDDNEKGCFPHLVIQGSPADSVKAGMTRAEVISTLKAPYFSTGVLIDYSSTGEVIDSSRDSFAYVQEGEVRYLIVEYRYDTSMNSTDPLIVSSVSDGHYRPYTVY